MADIRVGSIAIAKRTAGEWSIDESAVCFEIYEMEEGRVGYSFVFEKGGYDGFNLEEVDTYLHVTRERQRCACRLSIHRRNTAFRRSCRRCVSASICARFPACRRERERAARSTRMDGGGIGASHLT